MVQILPERGFAAGLQKSLPGALEKLIGNIQERKGRKKEDIELKRLGIDVEGVRDPNIRKQLVDAAQKRKEKETEGLEGLQQNKILRKYFGPEFAELHGALGTGEQTKFFEQVLESHQRGESARKLLGKWEKQAGEPSTSIPEELGEEQIDTTEAISPEGITDTFEEVEEVGMTPQETVAKKGKEEERSFQRNKGYLERISDMANELSKEGLALQQMKGALDSGDFNSFRNVIGEMLGAEVLKTASAQVVNSASKQFLLSSLASITGGGRPNQFLEKQITKALVSPLYREEANLLIYEGLEGLHNLKRREIEIAQEEENKYTAGGGEVPRNFQQIVRKKIQKEAKAFEKEYEQRVKELLSSKDDLVMMISPEGVRGTLPKDQVADALKNKGYKRA